MPLTTKVLIIFLGIIFLFPASPPLLRADSEKISADAKSRLFPLLKDPSVDLFMTRFYWKNGLHIDGRYKKLRFRIGGAIMMDGGTVKTNTNINRAFPGFENTKPSLRKCTLDINAVFFDSVEAKLQFDFANINEVKDEWIRFTNNSILQRFRFGNLKEPFSLENASSDMNLSFMEKALPSLAFSPGRNIGTRYDDLTSAGNLTWAIGAFFNTDSFNNEGSAADQIGKSNGWDLTGRITYLLKWNKKKRNFLHLGLSYTHQFRGKGGEKNDDRFSALPESYLTNTRLVDTGKFAVDSIDILDTEVAYVSGPFSVQGE